MSLSRRTRAIAWKFATGTYAATLLCLSLIRLPHSASPGIPNFDKLLHFVAYAILAFMLRMSLKSAGSKRPYLSAFTIAVCFGAIVEVLQFVLTDYRFFSLGDIIANALGAASALLVARGLLWRENYLSS